MSGHNKEKSISTPDEHDRDILIIVRAINDAGEFATEDEIYRGLKWMAAVRAAAACLSLVEKGLLSARFPNNGDAEFAKPVAHPIDAGKPSTKGAKR